MCITVTPLGTVSPYPSCNKNGPGFLIEHEDYKILLDCGEGCSRLLNLPNDFNNLIIIISHLHKDHYSGLGGIGYASYVYKNLGYLKDKIKVYITKDNIPDFEYLINFKDENYLEFITYGDNDKINHGNLEITFAKNPHPIITYSAKIKTKNNTIVYSADTGFKNNTLINFSKNADLLICESTFLKEQKKDNDNHLSTYEAGTIAKLANIKELLLTHFFPTIDKQEYVNETRKIFENTHAAEEGKKIILKK